MVTTTPISRRRCQLCLTIVEISQVVEGRMTQVTFQNHTPESCEKYTLQRIKVLEELHMKDSMYAESQSQTITDLSHWIGICTKLVDAGKKWVQHRDKRQADIARLRSAFGTGERADHHPLWAAEEEVAEAMKVAIEVYTKKAGS